MFFRLHAAYTYCHQHHNHRFMFAVDEHQRPQNYTIHAQDILILCTSHTVNTYPSKNGNCDFKSPGSTVLWPYFN